MQNSTVPEECWKYNYDCIHVFNVAADEGEADLHYFIHCYLLNLSHTFPIKS